MKLLFAGLLCFFTGTIFSQFKVDFAKAPSSPVILAEGFVSTQYSERDFSLSPDGTELFFTLQSPARAIFQTILYSKKDVKGNWSKPEVASFAGHYSDLEPAFSADGKRLYFCSNRPLTGTDIKDFDIWYCDKVGGKWSQPVNVGEPVNTNADEFYPSVAKNGNLYFTAEYPNSIGREDIHMAKFENGKYLKPVPLDTGVNSKTYEFNAFVSPDEDFIIFTSYGRDDDKGGGDLYMSTKNADGHWNPARNLSALNSEKLDYCPFVSFDRKLLFFTSERNSLKKSFSDKPATYERLTKSFSSILNGGGNIYWMDFKKLRKL